MVTYGNFTLVFKETDLKGIYYLIKPQFSFQSSMCHYTNRRLSLHNCQGTLKPVKIKDEKEKYQKEYAWTDWPIK